MVDRLSPRAPEKSREEVSEFRGGGSDSKGRRSVRFGGSMNATNQAVGPRWHPGFSSRRHPR